MSVSLQHTSVYPSTTSPAAAPVNPSSAAALAHILLEAAITASTCAESCLEHGDLARLEPAIAASLAYADSCTETARRLQAPGRRPWGAHRRDLVELQRAARECTRVCRELSRSYLFCRDCVSTSATTADVTAEILGIMDA